ncbi:MAG: 6-bladed beta-propeller [Chloroflexi bacterium]|nr:MAG: 6-bladed beta-propeller [Chloroflexota bacterium]
MGASPSVMGETIAFRYSTRMNRKYIRAIGREGRAPSEFVNPCCVAFDPQGRLYVADAGRNDIQVFDMNGRFVRIIGGPGKGQGEFSRLGVPYIDPATGLIWVPDYANDRVEVVDANGLFVAEYRADDNGRSFTGVNGLYSMPQVDSLWLMMATRISSGCSPLMEPSLPEWGRVYRMNPRFSRRTSP